MATCKNHPSLLAVGRCSGCAEEFCPNCLVNIQGQQYCGACKVLALQGKVPMAAVAAQEAGTIPCPQAKEALMYAIVSFFCFGFILGPIAIFKAIKARKIIAENPQLSGDGKALAALIMGIISSCLNFLFFAAKFSSLGK